jgi:hypothetical protein
MTSHPIVFCRSNGLFYSHGGIAAVSGKERFEKTPRYEVIIASHVTAIASMCGA